MKRNFQDKASFDATSKTAISVRDGVLEYLGAEIGFEPPDKIFTVYRSPATIANAAMRMAGIPVTVGHVSIEDAAPDTGSTVESSAMIDAHDPSTSTTIAIKNSLTMSAEMLDSAATDREMSLGYGAELVPHNVYDLEQLDIQPHHLAIVPSGRNGRMCSFLDRKPTTQEKPSMTHKLHKAFTDADGELNLQQIAEIAAGLPEAIKSVPLAKLQEMLPMLKEIMAAAKGAGVVDPDETEVSDEDKEKKEPAAEKEGDKKFSDADVELVVAKRQKEFADAAIKRHTEVIEKARTFLDAEYSFSDKDTNQIMRDALATEQSETFADAELPLAFKMLKKASPDYSKFGDKKTTGGLANRIKEDLGE